MLGFFMITGRQGSGKTLLCTKHAFEEYAKGGKKVYSNYELKGIPFEYITFNTDIEVNKEKRDILKTLDEDPNYFDNSIMLLDEMHLYLDSYDFMKKNNRRLQTFFTQLRKRNILLIGTTQFFMSVDIRIRRQAMAIIEMKHIKGSLFRYDSHDVDDYYLKLVSSNYLDLKRYYNCYNTNELIL